MYVYNGYNVQNQMFSDLVTFRNSIAHDAAIPPFMVASNKLLADLTTIRSVTLHVCMCACMHVCMYA